MSKGRIQVPSEALLTPQNYGIEGFKVAPLFRETQASRTANVNFSSLVLQHRVFEK